MSLFNVFDISGSAMSAQITRLNTISSNLANAEVVVSDPKNAYRSKQPIFKTQLQNSYSDHNASFGVSVSEITESTEPTRKKYSPGHALADKDGYIHLSNVNVMNEMANMISASRSYQMNVQVLNNNKDMMLKTLQLGK